MSENENGSDWFEEALEDDTESEEPADTGGETTPGEDESAFDADAFGESEDSDEGPAFDADASGDTEDSEEGTAFDADASGDTEVTDEETAFDADAFGESEDTAEESAFDADAFGESEDTGTTDGTSAIGESDADSPFDDDFESAFGGGGDSEFEEDLESTIPRIDLGIEGLDEMIQGGVPDRHLMTAIGSAGTGKTTFGLQFLQHGLQQGDSGVFITLEQSREEIVATADEWGWEFVGYEEEGTLAIVDLDPVEMANSLDNIRGELPDLIRDFGADRLVLDSVSLLEMMYEDQSRRRTEVFDFTRSLKEAGVTTFLTSEASETNPYASRHGIIEYLTDAVFILQYVRGETQEARLAVEIQKIRNTNHSREMKPYEITSDGLSVYQQANIF